MRMKLRHLLPLASFAVVAGAQAQVVPVPKFRLHLGYGFSDSFHDDSGHSGRIQGADFGADLLVASVAGTDFSVSPSVLIGTSDEKGDVYRLEATARRMLGQSLYGTIGVGYATAQSGHFSGDTGAITRFGLGYSLTSVPGPVRPILELSVITGGSAQLRGYFIGVSGGF